MYPLAGDDLEAVFLEILGTVLLRELVEFDTVVHRHTRDQHLFTPADRVQRIAMNSPVFHQCGLYLHLQVIT